MKVLEFGNITNRKIILIHGFQCPWQVWNKYIEYYKDKFHIIVPIMSGHNPEVKEDFISFASDAKEIEDYILSRYGKDIYAVYGMSMGGVLTAILWQNNRLIFDKVIFDGSPLVSYNSLMKEFMKKFYVDITHKSRQRDKKTVERATKVIISEDNLEYFLKVIDNMSDTTVDKSIEDIANFKLSQSIHTPDTVVYFFHGTAANEMLAKKSAKYVSKYYPNTIIKCFKGKFHCENALFNQKIMIEELDKILDK
ncbi:alpha/beta fold hydrolase [Microaceticoccus formicicus]|uniref:alpha/beta fold hydrolase n=1 Tax=Microaceticoccus formicicus TaxID=3118105 RepID=UPI003CCFFBCB|nr:alpha/beta hydrolase [Peptoniphilaceae bacterium AMB_02]